MKVLPDSAGTECWTLYWFSSLDRREALGVVVTRSGFLKREESSVNPRFSCRWELKVTAGEVGKMQKENLLERRESGFRGEGYQVTKL